MPTVVHCSGGQGKALLRCSGQGRTSGTGRGQVGRVGLVVLRLLMSMSLVVTARVNRVGVAVGAILVIWVHKRSWDPGKKGSRRS